MRPDDVGLGGFDSHTLPPAFSARAFFARALGIVGASLLITVQASAQTPDTTKVVPAFVAQSTDTVVAAKAAYTKPPITARRAFLYSALVPGMGQAALDRKYTGAVFFLIEAMSWALVRRSAEDERIAKSFVGDSVPQSYAIDPGTGLAQRDAHGNPVVATWAPTRYTQDLVRARALHVEDWVAVILFNHLFAGADAYVAANLWDLPQHLPNRMSVRAIPLARGGAALNFSVSFR